MFVNIQHPGENTTVTQMLAVPRKARGPASGGRRARSATVVITKDDGGTGAEASSSFWNQAERKSPGKNLPGFFLFAGRELRATGPRAASSIRASS